MSHHKAATAADNSQGRYRPGGKNADKARLSRGRRRDVVENDEYGAFARRIVRAYARLVGAGDIDALASRPAWPPSWTPPSRTP